MLDAINPDKYNNLFIQIDEKYKQLCQSSMEIYEFRSIIWPKISNLIQHSRYFQNENFVNKNYAGMLFLQHHSPGIHIEH